MARSVGEEKDRHPVPDTQHPLHLTVYQTKKGHLRKDSEENPTSEDGSGSSTSRREQCVKWYMSMCVL